jgi:hypothetical protein
MFLDYFIVLKHLSDHVIQNAAVTEINQFHFGVEPNDDAETSAVAHLQNVNQQKTSAT